MRGRGVGGGGEELVQSVITQHHAFSKGFYRFIVDPAGLWIRGEGVK